MPAAGPEILQFFSAWHAIRGDRIVPYRRDFDPIAIPALLSSIWLYRYEHERGDFVCRLAGEDVNEAWGRNIKGRTLREVIGAHDHPMVLERWRRIVSGPMLHYGFAVERMTNQELRRAERLILPLANDADEICYTIGLSLYRIGPVDPMRTALHPEDVIQIPCTELQA